MIHNSTQTNPEGDHYAVGMSAAPAGEIPLVLIQIQENGNQARIPLTRYEARYLAQLLLTVANTIEFTYMELHNG